MGIQTIFTTMFLKLSLVPLPFAQQWCWLMKCKQCYKLDFHHSGSSRNQKLNYSIKRQHKLVRTEAVKINQFNGTVQLKNKSLFSHPHALRNLFNILSSRDDKRWFFFFFLFSISDRGYQASNGIKNNFNNSVDKSDRFGPWVKLNDSVNAAGNCIVYQWIMTWMMVCSACSGKKQVPPHFFFLYK